MKNLCTKVYFCLIVIFLLHQNLIAENTNITLFYYIKKQNVKHENLNEKQAFELLPSLQYDPTLVDLSYASITNTLSSDYEFSQASKYIVVHEGENEKLSQALLQTINTESRIKIYCVLKFLDKKHFIDNFDKLINIASSNSSYENYILFLERSLQICPEYLQDDKYTSILNKKSKEIKHSVSALNQQFSGQFHLQGLSNHPLHRADKLLDEILSGNNKSVLKNLDQEFEDSVSNFNTSPKTTELKQDRTQNPFSYIDFFMNYHLLILALVFIILCVFYFLKKSK